MSAAHDPGVEMFDWIGWTATATFASSYLFRQQTTMRRVQGVAALMWSVYGGLIHALPVLVANLIVAAMAIGSSFTPRSARST